MSRRTDSTKAAKDAPERRARARRQEDRGGDPERPYEQRRYPRRSEQLRVRVFRSSGKQTSFEASVKTSDISVGGVYLESSFFLRVGLELELEFWLPEMEESIQLSGEVVNVVDETSAGARHKPTGFAIRFTGFHGDAEVHLRAFLAQGDLYGFVKSFANKQLPHVKAADQRKLVEMVVRWEMLQDALAE